MATISAAIMILFGNEDKRVRFRPLDSPWPTLIKELQSKDLAA